jgi:hypothetical protein
MRSLPLCHSIVTRMGRAGPELLWHDTARLCPTYVVQYTCTRPKAAQPEYIGLSVMAGQPRHGWRSLSHESVAPLYWHGTNIVGRSAGGKDPLSRVAYCFLFIMSESSKQLIYIGEGLEREGSITMGWNSHLALSVPIKWHLGRRRWSPGQLSRNSAKPPA